MTARRLDRALRRLFLAPSTVTSAAGEKLSYTVPAGKSALLRTLLVIHRSGAPQTLVRIFRGATEVIINNYTTANVVERNLGIPLEAGDKVSIHVTTPAVGGSLSDMTIGIEESP